MTSGLALRLARDHRRLGRVLDLLAGLIERFDAGEESSYDLFRELIEYVVDYVERVHHPTEDVLFTRLAAQAPAQAAILADLMREHRELTQLSRDFRDALASIMHGAVLPRATVVRQGRELVRRMRAHIDREDETALPLASALLSETEWAALATQAPNDADPIFGQPDPLRFRALYDHLKDVLDPL